LRSLFPIIINCVFDHIEPTGNVQAKRGKKMGAGSIAGLVLGIIVLIAVILAVVFVIVKKRRCFRKRGGDHEQLVDMDDL
jgi:hypothetical protein